MRYGHALAQHSMQSMHSTTAPMRCNTACQRTCRAVQQHPGVQHGAKGLEQLAQQGIVHGLHARSRKQLSRSLQTEMET
jgi:hypothetical protein